MFSFTENLQRWADKIFNMHPEAAQWEKERGFSSVDTKQMEREKKPVVTQCHSKGEE